MNEKMKLALVAVVAATPPLITAFAGWVEAKAQSEKWSGTYDDYEQHYLNDLKAEARCDAALEAFARHRDDERDWAHVLEACHSEGGIE